MTHNDEFENLFDLTGLFPSERPALPTLPAEASRGPDPARPVITAPAAATRLRNHLGAIFPLCDERCTFPAPGRPFKIDDCSGSDRWKWIVSADVLDTEPPTLVIHFQSVPCDDQLLEALRDLGVTPQIADGHARFELSLQTKYAPKLRKLIPAIRRVVKSFPTRRWLTGRVGDSLKQLADHLAEFRA